MIADGRLLCPAPIDQCPPRRIDQLFLYDPNVVLEPELLLLPNDLLGMLELDTCFLYGLLATAHETIALGWTCHALPLLTECSSRVEVPCIH